MSTIFDRRAFDAARGPLRFVNVVEARCYVSCTNSASRALCKIRSALIFILVCIPWYVVACMSCNNLMRGGIEPILVVVLLR